MRHLKAGHARATAELNILRKRFEAIEVLREEIHALKCGAASADELCEPVVHLEGSSGRACGARSMVCLSLHWFLYFRCEPHAWY
jgi:hypothetical protein